MSKMDKRRFPLGFQGSFPSWMVLDEFHLGYLPIPKNANSWLKAILLSNSYNAKHFNPQGETAYEFLGSGGLRGSIFGSSLSKVRKKNLRKFVILREPKSRLVSGWLDKFVKKYPYDTTYSLPVASALGKSVSNLSFRDLLVFINTLRSNRVNPHFRRQSDWFAGIDDLNFFDFIGRVEEPSDVERFLISVGLSIPPFSGNPGIYKKTDYQEFGTALAEVGLDTISGFKRLPTKGDFFGDSEEELFHQFYSADLQLYDRFFPEEQ